MSKRVETPLVMSEQTHRNKSPVTNVIDIEKSRTEMLPTITRAALNSNQLITESVCHGIDNRKQMIQQLSQATAIMHMKITARGNENKNLDWIVDVAMNELQMKLLRIWKMNLDAPNKMRLGKWHHASWKLIDPMRKQWPKTSTADKSRLLMRHGQCELGKTNGNCIKKSWSHSLCHQTWNKTSNKWLQNRMKRPRYWSAPWLRCEIRSSNQNRDENGNNKSTALWKCAMV